MEEGLISADELEKVQEDLAIAEEILIEVARVLRLPYVDDLAIGPPLPSYISYAIRKCKACVWCKECIDLCTETERVHPKVCPLYGNRSEIPERVPCPCVPCDECEEWQRWVRPDPFGCVTMTRKEWSDYMSWLGNIGKEFLNKLVKAVLRILQFSSFTLKSIDSNLESLRVIHREFYGPEEKVVDYFTRKPEAERVREEGLRMKHKPGEWVVEDVPVVPKRSDKPFLIQMGKEFFSNPEELFSDTVGIKTRYLEVSRVQKVLSSGPMHSQAAFDEYMEKIGGNITRRLFTSLAGSMYDPNNSSLVVIIPIMLAKTGLFDLYMWESLGGTSNAGKPKLNLPGWDDKCTPEAIEAMKTAARAFFLLKDKRVPRCTHVLGQAQYTNGESR